MISRTTPGSSRQRLTSPVKILIADDHEVVAEGLRHILARPEYEIVGVATDGRTLVRLAAELRPGLIITKVDLPSKSGIDATREILAQNPVPRIVFFTRHSEVAHASAALAAGASGYVLKTAASQELIKAIRAVLAGGSYVSKAIAKFVRSREVRPRKIRGASEGLTHRQLEILQLLAEGRHIKEIAALLRLSPKTVEFHKYRIMDLLGLRTVTDLVRYALKRGIVA